MELTPDLQEVYQNVQNNALNNPIGSRDPIALATLYTAVLVSKFGGVSEVIAEAFPGYRSVPKTEIDSVRLSRYQLQKIVMNTASTIDRDTHPVASLDLLLQSNIVDVTVAGAV